MSRKQTGNILKKTLAGSAGRHDVLDIYARETKVEYFSSKHPYITADTKLSLDECKIQEKSIGSTPEWRISSGKIRWGVEKFKRIEK